VWKSGDFANPIRPDLRPENQLLIKVITRFEYGTVITDAMKRVLFYLIGFGVKQQRAKRPVEIEINSAFNLTRALIRRNPRQRVAQSRGRLRARNMPNKTFA